MGSLLTLEPGKAPGQALSKLTLFAEEGTGAAVSDIGTLKRSGGAEILLAEGAFTESQGRRLLQAHCPKEGLTLLARDASCLMLKRETWEALRLRGMEFKLLQPTSLAAVTVNPFSAGGWQFDGAAFKEKMQGAVPVPVLDVQE